MVVDMSASRICSQPELVCLFSFLSFFLSFIFSTFFCSNDTLLEFSHPQNELEVDVRETKDGIVENMAALDSA